MTRTGWLLPLLALATPKGEDSGAGPDWNALGRRWWADVQVLANDDMEGRDTGSRGMEKAAEYVTRQFRAAGLQPGGSAGYRQPVDFLVTQVVPAQCALDLIRDNQPTRMTLGDDAAVIVTSQTVESAEAGAVFVGYGLTVPELNYDDLSGRDLAGKFAVYIRGGPAEMPGPIKAHYQSPEERSGWLRKAGAVGAIAILNPTAPDLPWPRLVSGLTMPRMELRDPGRAVPLPLPSTVVFNPERAEKLFEGSGHSFAELVAHLGSEGPLPTFALPSKVRLRVGLTRREAGCQNVAGALPGSDPALRNEWVVVSAHLDHLGIGEPINGDSVYSGALDNASGAAGLLEIARSLHEAKVVARRSILFLAVTGEEKGLLGSQYYATHPTVPGPIIANVNIDELLALHPLQYLEVQGLAESSLGGDLRAVAEEMGVGVHAEYEPDRVLFIRSDQYNFIKEGVPAIYPGFGYLRGSPEEQLAKAWVAERYHAPSDDTDQPVDLPAAAQFIKLVEKLVLRISNADRRPTWNSDSFFRRFVH